MPPLPPSSGFHSLLSRSLIPGICGVVIFAASPAFAQQQERSLLERIEKPDMTLSFGAQKTEFHGAKDFSGGKGARVKSFYSPAKFRAKDYMTGSYADRTGPWRGDFTYNTKSANTDGRGWTQRAVREHRTKDVAVKDSRDANRNYRTAEHSSANRSSGFKGKSQDKIDIYGPQSVLSIPSDSGFQELRTIDDIRNLLNKD